MKLTHVGLVALCCIVGVAGCQKESPTRAAVDTVTSETADSSTPETSLVPVGWNRWPTDAPAEPVVTIPQLAEPFIADGELTEWGSALSVPIRSDSLVTYVMGDQKWRGPDDASMDCFVAWTPEGLAVAMAVRDDDLINDDPVERPWDYDCCAVIIEPREITGAPWRVGVLGIPPQASGPNAPFMLPGAGSDPSELAYKSVRTSDGYVIEMLVPWSAMHAEDESSELSGQVGTEFGLRLSMIDYDARDGEQLGARGFTWHASWLPLRTLSAPGRAARTVLGDTLVRSPQTDLKMEVFLDVDHCPPPADAQLPVHIDLGINIGPDVEEIELFVDDWRAQRVVAQRLPLTSTTTSAGRRKGASYTWDLTGVPDGQYRMTARVLGADDALLGLVERDILVTRGVVEKSLSRIVAAGIPTLAGTQPFAALDWLQVATNLERLKREIATRDLQAIGEQRRELMARLALLEEGVVPAADDAMLDLLGLTTDSESQVVVEYVAGRGHVSFYWGPVQIVSVAVESFVDEDAAKAGMAAYAQERPTEWFDDGVIDGTFYQMRQGRRVFYTTNASVPLGKAAVAAVASGEPITVAQVDAMRAMLVDVIEVFPVEPLPFQSVDMQLFVGDVHTHTLYSDGTYSPIYMTMQGFCSGMDFSVITDHNAVVGGQLVEASAARYGFDHTIIPGEELTTFAHLNAYPLREVVDWTQEPAEFIGDAHAQGAVIQWNHPILFASDAEWFEVGLEQGIEPLGVDAWEHVPPRYDEWRHTDMLPTLVGSTDEHAGFFFNPERSIILAPSASGPDLAEAIRRNNVCIFEPTMAKVVYGPPHMIGRVREALDEGDAIRARKAARIRADLAELDIAGLIRSSGATRLSPDEVGELIRDMERHSHDD
jgi:hypothetical protein